VLIRGKGQGERDKGKGERDKGKGTRGRGQGSGNSFVFIRALAAILMKNLKAET